MDIIMASSFSFLVSCHLTFWLRPCFVRTTTSLYLTHRLHATCLGAPSFSSAISFAFGSALRFASLFVLCFVSVSLFFLFPLLLSVIVLSLVFDFFSLSLLLLKEIGGVCNNVRSRELPLDYLLSRSFPLEPFGMFGLALLQH